MSKDAVAMRWAMTLPDEEFEQVITLLEREYNGIVQEVKEFAALNCENDAWVDCLYKLLDYLEVCKNEKYPVKQPVNN